MGRFRGTLLLLASAVAFAILAVPAGQARAAPYAAIVMDMRDGRVLHEDSADRRQHPASLTKMMTLYLAFEAVETGQLGLDQKVRVSRHASRQPPSKIWLKPGQRVTIRHLIRAAAIRSANDAAMVLAEAIGGSQREFARLMTEKARALGMSSTTFRNPHGLTQKGHLSTARDMARLARHLYFDFPEYYNVFGRKSAYAAGKRVYTTNRLLGRYRGAEGMKTGYTSAAGYNLVATARRGSERVIAVVMGGKSSRWRNRRVAQLLDRGFRAAPSRVAEVPPDRRRAAVAKAPLPEPRPAAPVTGLAALAAPAQAATRAPRGTRSAPAYAALPEAREWERAAGVAEPQAQGAAASGIPLPPARPLAGSWAVQIGAFMRRRSAEASLRAVDLDDFPMLARGRSMIETSRSAAGKPIYKVRYVGLQEGHARAACRSIKRSGGDCLAIAPR